MSPDRTCASLMVDPEMSGGISWLDTICMGDHESTESLMLVRYMAPHVLWRSFRDMSVHDNLHVVDGCVTGS